METTGAAAAERLALAALAREGVLAVAAGADSARARAATRNSAMRPPRADEFRSTRDVVVMGLLVGMGFKRRVRYRYNTPKSTRFSPMTQEPPHVSEHSHPVQLR